MSTIDVSAIHAYESGDLSEDETIALFQHLVDTGVAWELQGSYGRAAQHLLDAGVIVQDCRGGQRETVRRWSAKAAQLEARIASGDLDRNAPTRPGSQQTWGGVVNRLRSAVNDPDTHLPVYCRCCGRALAAHEDGTHEACA